MRTERISGTQCKLFITMRELYEQFRNLDTLFICGTLVESTDLHISGFDGGRRSDAFYWPVTTRSFYAAWRKYMKIEKFVYCDYFEEWNTDTEFNSEFFKKTGDARHAGRSYRLRVLAICAERDPDYQFEIDCQLEDDSEDGIFRFME